MKRFLSARRRAMLADAGKRAGGHVAVALHKTLGDRGSGQSGILLYHRVVPFDATDAPPDAVTPSRFRLQLEGLLERGFHFVPLVEFIAAHDRVDTLPTRTVAVTFDDGYANVREHALPVLLDLAIPATVFVVTAYVGSAEPFPFDRWGRAASATAPRAQWVPLDWPACRELEATGLVDVGSHTHTHADFRGRPLEFASDVRTSLALLNEHLEPRPRPFAFPFGTVRTGFAGPDLVRAAKSTGVTCALTTEIELVGPASDPFSWGRVEAVESDSAASCAAKLSGWYNWMGTTRSVFQRIAPRSP
jgi:peptidoglycan/xylan/chitin deacetylase (PgdA/CDA1 family)